MADMNPRRVRTGDVDLQVRIDGSDGPWVVLAHALGRICHYGTTPCGIWRPGIAY